MIVALLISTPSLAGYGDAVDGLPTPAEREMHAWTNMVRMDPASFTDDYACNFNSFQPNEKTPKPPFMWNIHLNEAANFHSGDMSDYDYFDHDSIDGTSWSTRIHRYYDPGTIGENIAWGYGSVYASVIEGWMCSSGHRVNIMKEGYDEMGPGVADRYYTQDFGYGGVAVRPIPMGAHIPSNPSGEVDLVADFHVQGGDVPIRFQAVVNSEAHDMQLILGTENQGSWWVRLPTNDDCHLYYFETEVGSGQTARFPEDGSYGWGDCDFDDPIARWSSWQDEAPDDGETGGTTGGNDDTTSNSDADEPSAYDDAVSIELGTGGCGCSTPATAPSLLGLLPLLMLIRRRD